MTSLAWMDQAACRGIDTNVFFLDRGGHAAERARELCADCPVQVECLEFGIKEEFGIFGGLAPRERQKIRAARRKQRQRTSSKCPHGRYPSDRCGPCGRKRP